MATTRGTTNRNDRGSSKDRAARRAFLLASCAANVQVLKWDGGLMHPASPGAQATGMANLERHGLPYDLLATCRCYRCGCLLVDGTLTVDRIIPGCQGGTYRRDNIRPACGTCNSETGGSTRGKR